MLLARTSLACSTATAAPAAALFLTSLMFASRDLPQVKSWMRLSRKGVTWTRAQEFDTKAQLSVQPPYWIPGTIAKGCAFANLGQYPVKRQYMLNIPRMSL
jgi:hypothetical protein